MSWAKLDDSFPDNPKIVVLSDSAFRLHVESLCYAARNLTDGAIAAAAARRLTNGEKRACVAELVDAGLWETTAEGWQIHDFLEFQPSRAHVLADREAARLRKQKQRERAARPPSHAVTPTGTDAVSPASPSRPVPSPENQSSVTTATRPTDQDDDDLESKTAATLAALVELKLNGRQLDNPTAYRTAVESSVVPEFGTQVVSLLADHPEWPPRWVAQEVLGLPRSEPKPSEVITACEAGHGPDGLVDTGDGMALCPKCSWARNGTTRIGAAS